MDRQNILKIGFFQMTSIDDVSINHAKMIEAIKKMLSQHELDLVCFPESSLYFRINEGEKISGISESNSLWDEFAQIAAQNKVFIHLGAIPFRDLEGLWNASVYFDDMGKKHISYRKIHLFDVNLDGQESIRESDVYRAGVDPRVFNCKGWVIGQSICYDLRFSELYLNYVLRENVDIILIPSAFTVQTGKAHWKTLVRARAIESQAFIVACAQGGVHNGVSGGKRLTYGHSMVIDPWGRILKEIDAFEDLIGEVLILDYSLINTVRKQIPMSHHRKLAVSFK